MDSGVESWMESGVDSGVDLVGGSCVEDSGGKTHLAHGKTHQAHGKTQGARLHTTRNQRLDPACPTAPVADLGGLF